MASGRDGLLYVPKRYDAARPAPKLKAAGYDLDHREFDGGHAAPPEIVTAAAVRFLN